MIRKTAVLVVALSVAVSLPQLAAADWMIGSGRASGMGRAGLAVPYDWLYSGRLNPAIYGLAPSSTKFQIPGLRFRFDGIAFSDLQDFSSSIGNGGLDANKLSNLAQKFGDQNVEFGTGVQAGFYSSGLMLDFVGDGLASTRPNATLQNWVQNGSQGVAPAGSQLDGYGIAGYELGIAYGRRINNSGPTDLSFGARLKIVRSYYSHSFVDANSIQNNGASTLASEMNGKDVLTENGVGLDIGVVASSSKTQGFFFGATVDNLIRPNVAFDGTLPNGAPGNTVIKPYNTSLNFGAGYLTPSKVMLAADFYDVTNSARAQEFRAGAEYIVSKGFALRGGYASRTGLTFGVGLGEFNFAFSSGLPGQFAYTFRF